MTNDMTRGNPVRLILAFMIPTFLGNIFQQFYNLVDSVVAGRHIGVEALAAIGSTTSLIFLVRTGLRSGVSELQLPCFTAVRAEIALMSGGAFAVTHHPVSS